MGWFDALRRKPTLSEPGPHHYAVAHFALRRLALAEPLMYFATIGLPFANELFENVHRDVCERFRAQGPPDFKASQIRGSHEPIGETELAAVVTMPPPRGVTEAYHTALVLIDAPSEDESPGRRYFTLERTHSDTGGEAAVFCEWTEEGHSLIGPCEVGLAPFLEAIREELARTRDRSGD
jgi:hypothetical protein